MLCTLWLPRINGGHPFPAVAFDSLLKASSLLCSSVLAAAAVWFEFEGSNVPHEIARLIMANQSEEVGHFG